MKNRYWILIFGAIFTLCLALVFFPKNVAPAQTAQVVSEGKTIRILDLSTPQEFTVTVDGGSNTITVRDGKIAVTHSDCPNHDCVRMGWLQDGGAIVCLPNRMEIRLTGSTDVDVVIP